MGWGFHGGKISTRENRNFRDAGDTEATSDSISRTDEIWIAVRSLALERCNRLVWYKWSNARRFCPKVGARTVTQLQRAAQNEVPKGLGALMPASPLVGFQEDQCGRPFFRPININLTVKSDNKDGT